MDAMSGSRRGRRRRVLLGIAATGVLAVLGSPSPVGATWTDAVRFAAAATAAAPAGWTVTTLAGTGVAGHEDGPGASARFNLPAGVALDAAGSLVVGGGADNRVRRVTVDGLVSTLAGSGVDGHVDGPASTAQFTNPFYPAFDAAGHLFVGDAARNQLIRRIAPDGTVSTFATGMNGPRGLVFGPAGELYVANSGLRRISRITPAGVVSTFTGSGVQGFADGGASTARFCSPSGMAFGPDGQLFVADGCNGRVRRVAPDGTVSTLAAGITGPAGVALHPSGDLIVGATGRVLRIAPDGTVTTIAGTGAVGFRDGPGPIAQFGVNDGIAVDAAGVIYVVDMSNHRIRRIVEGPLPW